MNKTYTPNPIDNSAVSLPEEIRELGELLAKNTHENFVKMRIASGWRYGPQRDDIKKTNPTLIPYEELPESEKEYDRVTSLETLKTILALGYRICRVEESGQEQAGAQGGRR